MANKIDLSTIKIVRKKNPSTAKNLLKRLVTLSNHILFNPLDLLITYKFVEKETKTN